MIGTGRALPQRIVSNAELSRRLNISEAEIVRKTGIESRYWVGAEEKPSTLAAEAGRKAIEAAHLLPDEIDLLLVTTTTPDMYFPSTACMVQKILFKRSIPAFDLNASCSGFLYALSVADQYLKNGSVDRVLVIATDVKSRFINKDDVSTAILFGDGAGAVVLVKGDRGIQSIQIGADGSYHELVHLPGGGACLPLTGASLKEGRHFMRMEGKGLFRVAVRKMESALTDFLKQNHLSVDEVDFFIFHQANLRILEALFQRIEIPIHKTELTLSKFGNTSSSTIPIALNTAFEAGKLKQGDRVVLSAFGGGITWGNILLEW